MEAAWEVADGIDVEKWVKPSVEPTNPRSEDRWMPSAPLPLAFAMLLFSAAHTESEPLPGELATTPPPATNRVPLMSSVLAVDAAFVEAAAGGDGATAAEAFLTASLYDTPPLPLLASL